MAAGLASFGLAIALNSVFHFWAWLVYYIYLRAYGEAPGRGDLHVQEGSPRITVSPALLCWPAVIPKEERSLKGWFGGAYVAYSYKVSRWGVPVPFL